MRSGEAGGRASVAMDFSAWYDATHRGLLASVNVVVRDETIAAEAVDEACLRAYARWSRVSDMGSPTGWAFRVAENHARKLLRRRQIERFLHLDRPVTVAVLGDYVDLWNAVGELPARQREAVLMRYALDLPEAEIASAMGISRGAVSASLAQARRKLSESLGPFVREEGDPE
jgi:DNA-directed RNA polymerase specialized sigma24 family protein